MDSDSIPVEETKAKEGRAVSKRLMSLDALRGFDMFWIIGGGTIIAALHYAAPNPITAFLQVQLEHVEWQGFHIEDIIMPFNMF